MTKGFKRKILHDKNLLSLAGLISQIWFVIKLRKSFQGKNNTLHMKSNVILRGGRITFKGNNNKLIISDKCRLKNVRIEMFGNNNTISIYESVMFYENVWLCIEGDNCTITIGAKTTIGSADIFCGEGNTNIVIGKDCMFSREISMNTSDFHSIIGLEDGMRINPPKDIRIENHVWVGNNAFIGKGSIVRSDCVIASRAYLSAKDYPSNTIIGGLPAKILKQNVTWSREKLTY